MRKILPMQAYEAIETHFKRLGNIRAAAGILNWDAAVMMPKGSSAARGEQLATLSGLAHEMETAPQIADWLADAKAQGDLSDWQSANLREVERSYRHATALDRNLVEAMARTTTRCEMVWRDARPANDFATLAPVLGEVFALVKETATALSDQFGLDPYDAMLDQFQPGLRAATVDPIFAALTAELPGIIDTVLARQTVPVWPKGPFAKDKQKALGERLMAQLGFDFSRGRLDESAHPFSGGAVQDHRITTRYNDDDVVTGLMAVLHETGHALYEAGLPHAEHPFQPVASARGMALHESQSLFVEMQLCRSDGFIRHLATALRDTFGDDPAFQPDNLNKIYRTVQRGLIRVDADEPNYPLHVILRYRLEQQIIKGGLAVKDLPEAWRAGMLELVGIAPDNDKDGVMQDIHWPVGAFGYFPSYTLGALIAAQLFQAAETSLGDFSGALEQGEFAPIVAWLRQTIHNQGSKLEMDELIQQSTGQPLGETAFLAHVRERYLT